MQDGAQQPAAVAATVAEKIQAVKEQPRVQQVLHSAVCIRFHTWWSVEKHRVSLARCLISTYYFNAWVSS